MDEIKYFDLKVGYECNCNCIHCFIADRRETSGLTTKEIKDIIDKISPNSLVTVTGGEPTIRKDIVEILKYLKKKNHSVTLQTNGLKLADENLAKIVSEYVHETVFTFHSHIPSVHNKIYRSEKDTFEDAVKGIKNLYKYNANFETQTVITKFNLDHLYETCEFIQKLVPNTIMRITYPHTVGNAVSKDIIATYSDIKEPIQKVLKKWHDLIFTTYIPICYLYPYQDLKTGINNHDEFGYDIVDTGYDRSVGGKYVKNGEVSSYVDIVKSGKIKHPDCSLCAFNERCLGVWKEYKDLFGFIDINPIREIDYDLIEKIRTEDSPKNIIINSIEDVVSIDNNNIVEIVFNKDNINDIFNIYKKVVDFKPLKIIIRPSLEINEKYIPAKDLRKYFDDNNLIENITHHPTNRYPYLYDVPYCVMGTYVPFINNINEENKNMKVKMSICKNCKLKKSCDGIFKIDYKENSSGDLKPIL